MVAFDTAEATQAYRSRCEDRVVVVHLDNRVVVGVADGAGGTGSGGAAAESVVKAIGAHSSQCHNENDWIRLLSQLDQEIAPGESTAVVVDVRADGLSGASVGDSRAWIVCEGDVTDLTVKQVRKPLLGSGGAHAVGFTSGPLQGVLVAATDGFFNYVAKERVPPLLAQADFYTLPRKLIDLVRLPSGEFWDDVGIVVCRPTPARRTRERYVIP